MTQTETVTRQALEERVRPLLYINKIDRLINELKLEPQAMQETLMNIIKDFNNLIEIYAEPEFRSSWKVNPALNQVAFGSARDRWGFTLDIAMKKGIKFSDIVEAYRRGRVDELAKDIPLHEAILEMVIKHIPNPVDAQKVRIPKIWRGDLDSPVGRAMITCDDDGPVVMCVSNITVDPHAGIVATGRLFSGTISEGSEVYLIGARRKSRVQQVCIYMGPRREIVGSLSSGNIPALLGLDDARAGETIASIQDVVPFETVRYVTEPVITVAIEPKYSRDLPRLVDILRRLSIEDPNLVTHIDQESGEYLISGLGQVHIEIALTLIQKTGIEILVSKPTIIYRENIRGAAGPFMGKSPNKHNRVFISVEPLEPEIVDKIMSGELHDELDRRMKVKILRDAGWSPEDARNILAIDPHGCVLIDRTKGVQYLNEALDYVISGFISAMDDGPLCREYVRGVKVILNHAELHSDPAHRGPAQIIPAVRQAIYAAMLSANPTLLEPIMRIEVKTPLDMVGNVIRIITGRRGQIISLSQDAYLARIIGEIPAAETFDLAEVMRSTTSGKAFWSLSFSKWAPVPASMQKAIIAEIRTRKGLSPEPPKAEDFIVKE